MRVKRLLVALFVLLAAVPFAYLLLALVLGLLPVNRDFVAAREDETGVVIFIRTNGVHAEVMLPARGAGEGFGVHICIGLVQDAPPLRSTG